MSDNKKDLKNKLTSEQYRVTQEKGTERAFSGEYVNTKDKGIYKCVVCGEELFDSEAKFDSRTGWPSFDNAIANKIKEQEDHSHGMSRTEVVCNKCGGHLGHKFDDLPRHRRVKAGSPQETTGQRYCINSAALKLDKS